MLSINGEVCKRRNALTAANQLSKREVKNELLFIRGAQLARESRDYCSVRCASFDQMAHEK
jgi:hypothetical protein